MKFALIGHPVAGSMSPVLFSAAYGEKYGYELVDGSFEECWSRLLRDYEGVNVTAPYKQDAYSRCLVLSDNAAMTGAVNLVLRDGLRGYNTDVDGVVGAVKECGQPVSSALVVGTGGAARAAVAAALRLGLDVSVMGRNPEKVAAIEDLFGLKHHHTAAPDLVIYTLPGSAPVPSGLPLESAVVLEAEYKAPRLSTAACRHYISGLRWLLWQAAAGYELFTGETPSVAKMDAALEHFLQ